MSGMTLKFERKYMNGSTLTLEANGRTKEAIEKEYKLFLKIWEEFEALRRKHNWFV